MSKNNLARSEQQYEQPPPAYEAESSRPFLEQDEEGLLVDDMMKETVANSTTEIRMQFVRKVYSILTVQLLATSLLSSVYMFNDGIKHWVQTNHMVGTITSFYDQMIVLEALIINSAGMGPLLFAGACTLLIGGMLLPFFSGMDIPLAIGGVIIFSDYIMASTSLYMDMINLFLRILQILNAIKETK
ncbi:hypothetical protein BD560DRAFT_485623 [Blakeslea trispora]|nr:hypothetical protein BD560DRAFT_485623 [Blakeslea trispora]